MKGSRLMAVGNRCCVTRRLPVKWQQRRMRLHRLRRALEPLIRRLLHFYWRFSRGATLGARALVIDGAGPHLPGQAFLRRRLASAGRRRRDRRDACSTALARELAEEGNIVLTGAAGAARHILQQPRVAARPRRALHRARFPPGRCAGARSRNHRARLFSRPTRCRTTPTRATRARIAEVFEGVAVSEVW